MKSRKRRMFSKERIVMAASSVIILGALTATGLWIGNDKTAEEEGYVVDLSTIENETQAQPMQGTESQIAGSVTEEGSFGDDLDYDPYFQETNSAKVKNPDASGSVSMSDGVAENAADIQLARADDSKEAGNEKDKEEKKSDKKEDEAERRDTAAADAPAISTAMQPTLSFGENDPLVWPIVGNVLINYSMDKTIYFRTLDQYKYNPAIVIQANEGDMITAAAAGKVISVYEDPQIGNAVKMDLGNGYEITYGQLTNILVSEGSYVAMGDLIAQVAAPTKYYSVEGTNVYFMLTKDGEPLNPMTRLQE